MSRLLILVFSLLLTATAQEAPTPQQLIASAHKAVDLTSVGPYVLTGTVVVNPGTKGELTGSLLVHRDHDKARVDLQFGNRVETRITIDDRDFIDLGKLLISGPWLAEFDRLWDPERRDRSQFLPKVTSERVFRSKVNGTEAWCIQRKRDHSDEKECFDTAKKTMVSRSNLEFSDYVAAGSALVPQTIRIKDQVGAPIEVRKVQVSPFQVETAIFELPPHVVDFITCENAVAPQPVDTPTPVRSGLTHIETHSQVVIDIVVDGSGKVIWAQVLTRVGPAVEHSALEAVKRWRFKPATCNGNPINAQMQVEINGTLL